MQQIYNDPELALMYGRLKAQNFSQDAINLILDVYIKTHKPIEEIFASFSSDMDDELVRIIHDALV